MVFMVGTFWSAIILLFVFIPLILFWIFALADLFRRSDVTVVGRVVWLIVIIIFPLLGPVTYLLVRPPAEMVKYGSNAFDQLGAIGLSSLADAPTEARPLATSAVQSAPSEV